MKKIFASVVLGLMVFAVVAWMANYLSTGTIIITTSNKNDTITLQKTSGSEPFTRIAMGSLSVTVKHGQYTATIKNGSRTTIQVINFKEGHKTFRYSLSLASLIHIEPVAYENAQGLKATSRQLIYLDGLSHTLYKISGQNNLQEINQQQFQAVKWADPSFAIGQGSDGILYTIAGDSISPLKLPFSYEGGVTNFDVSSDKKIYVAFGADVYAGSQAGDFKQIYTAPSSKPALAAGVNGIAVSDSKYGGNASDISKPLLVTINASGKKTKKNIEAERVAWSPNGQYLAAVNQASPVIYDATLHQVAIIPTSSVVGQFEWLNDTTLLYSSGYQLWTYNLSDQKTQLLSGAPPTNSITGLYISVDGSYVYVTTFDPGSSSYAIRRIGLKGQRPPGYIYQLQDILPDQVGNYMATLVNFSGTPEIIIGFPPGANTQDGLKTIANDFQNRGINPSELHFRTMSLESH